MLEIVSSVQEIKQNKGDGRYRVRSVPVVNKVSGVDLIERVTFGLWAKTGTQEWSKNSILG